jgi:hypothetical protein
MAGSRSPGLRWWEPCSRTRTARNPGAGLGQRGWQQATSLTSGGFCRDKDGEGRARHTDAEAARARRRSRSYSPIRKRRRDSPSFMEPRRITRYQGTLGGGKGRGTTATTRLCNQDRLILKLEERELQQRERELKRGGGF